MSYVMNRYKLKEIEAEDARALSAQLRSGATVVELDTNLLEPSFAYDRLNQADDDAFKALAKSFEPHGQEVLILVRPHREKSGCYQIAFSHRRYRAAVALGRKIGAIVRESTNDGLVVVRGEENNERRNLNFIERALFALRLDERGFGRGRLIVALSVDTPKVTRFQAVARVSRLKSSKPSALLQRQDDRSTSETARIRWSEGRPDQGDF